jgi:hypothetical protein
MTDQTPQTTTEHCDVHHLLVEFANCIRGASLEKRIDYLRVFTDRINATTTPQPLAIGLDREAVATIRAALDSKAGIVDLRDFSEELMTILALAAPAESLWMMHVRGPDDIYPAPDYETALAWSDYVNDVLAKAVPEVMTKAVPAIWTGTPEQHAEGLPDAIKGWSLPAAPTGGRS